MYGSNFCSCTSSPRATSSRPIDAAEIPLPSEETTPPVMKMKRVSPGVIKPILECTQLTHRRYRGGRTVPCSVDVGPDLRDLDRQHRPEQVKDNPPRGVCAA